MAPLKGSNRALGKGQRRCMGGETKGNTWGNQRMSRSRGVVLKKEQRGAIGSRSGESREDTGV